MDKDKEDMLAIILADVKGQNEARIAKGKRPKFKLNKLHQSILIEKAVELYDRDKKSEKEISKLLCVSLPTIQNYIRGWKFKNVGAKDLDKFKEAHDKVLELEKGLTSESRIKLLSQIATNETNDAPTRISAIKALNELTSLTGQSSRFLLEIGVNKKSMAAYLAMLNIPKESIVKLLAITDAEEVARKMNQLNSNGVAVITTECFKDKVEKREIKDQEEDDQEEVNATNITGIANYCAKDSIPDKGNETKEKEVKKEEVEEDIFKDL